MPIFEFSLVFSVPEMDDDDTENVVIKLHKNQNIGDQISVGFGRPGQLVVDFFLEEATAEKAVHISSTEVKKTIPEACLSEIGPDLVNLSNLADLCGCTRQNIRKYASDEAKGKRDQFPLPAVTSDSGALWHLFQVSHWLEQNTQLSISNEVSAVSRIAAQMNVKITESILIGDQYWPTQEVESQPVIFNIRAPLTPSLFSPFDFPETSNTNEEAPDALITIIH